MTDAVPSELRHRIRDATADLTFATGAIEVQIGLAAATEMGDDVGDVPPRPSYPAAAVVVAPFGIAERAVELNGEVMLRSGAVRQRLEVVFEVAAHNAKFPLSGLTAPGCPVAGGSGQSSLDALEAKFPTGALATLAFRGPGWPALDRGVAELIDFIRPRDLDP
jgi:hypothetical protein